LDQDKTFSSHIACVHSLTQIALFMISCVLEIVVYCLVKQNLTSISIREEPQELKKPEAKEIKKRKEKFDLEKVNHYPTLDT
jgi:hypothetical protein